MSSRKSDHQPQIFHPSAVLVSGGDNIDARGVNAAVTEDVRQLGDVLFQPVKCAGEEMPQIVRKYFVGIDVGVLAHGFHLTPDIRAADRLAGARNEDQTSCDALFFCVLQQPFL